MSWSVPVRQRRRGRDSAWWPVAAVSATALAAATVPYLIALRRQDADHRFTGLVGGVDDNNVYLALMRQARDGAWLLKNTFTPEPSRPAVFNVLYELLGRLSTLTGVPLIAWHHLYGAAAAILLTFLAWTFFAGAFRDPRFRRAGVFLAVFASGVMGLRSLIGPAIGWRMRSPDSWLSELTTFHSILIYPHFVFSTMLVLASLVGFLSGLERARPGRALLGGLACTALVFSHAFDATIVLGTLAAFSTASFLREGRAALSRLVPPGLAFLAPLVPAILLTRWMLASEPRWSAVVARLDFPAPNPWELLMGTGITGVFAALFLVAGSTPAGGPPGRLTRVLLARSWVGAVIGLLYLPWIPWQWHLLNGIQIPLSLLALDGARRHAMTGRFALRRLIGLWPRRLASPVACLLVALCGVSALSDPQLVRMYVREVRNRASGIFLTPGEIAALGWLESSTPHSAVVLTAPEIGHFVPRLAGNTVVVGEDLLTENYLAKAAQASRFYSGATDAERLAMLRQWNIAYLVHGPAERALGSWDPASSAVFVSVFQSDGTSVYRVRGSR